MTIVADPTDDEIDASILAALTDELVPWSVIQRHVIGCYWCKATALMRLHDDGSIYLVKVRGRPYVCLGDDADAQLARIAKAQGRSRKVMVA
jgi:hypothetical protein